MWKKKKYTTWVCCLTGNTCLIMYILISKINFTLRLMLSPQSKLLESFYLDIWKQNTDTKWDK